MNTPTRNRNKLKKSVNMSITEIVVNMLSTTINVTIYLFEVPARPLNLFGLKNSDACVKTSENDPLLQKAKLSN